MEAANRSSRGGFPIARVVIGEPTRDHGSIAAGCGVRYALVNPNWTFDGSIYFGCREPHLPLEYAYARALLERAGHEVCLIDGQLRGLSDEAIAAAVDAFAPDRVVITTAPSYLFWRCAPPELRVPQQTLRAIRRAADPCVVVVGPHASSTPAPT